MVVAGAKGLARELLEIFSKNKALANLYFFDNVSKDMPAKLFDRFTIIRTFEEALKVFQETADFSFSLGLGNPVLRQRLYSQFSEIGGVLASVISPAAEIGEFDTTIGDGCCILPGVVITSGVRIGKGCLINPNATISHDSILGDFVEISPGVNVTGNCRIGDHSLLGANCVILPKVSIGKNVTIGAGAVVTKNIPDNSLAVGVPAQIKRSLPPLNF